MIKNSKWNCAVGVTSCIYKNADLEVRTSTKKDKPFVDKLQKENSFAVGFIQDTIWDKYVWGGERNFVVLICTSNSDPVGYVLFTPGKGLEPYGKIQQIAVRQDARRLEYGTALIKVATMFCEVLIGKDLH